jgi:hypothetical protein
VTQYHELVFLCCGWGDASGAGVVEIDSQRIGGGNSASHYGEVILFGGLLDTQNHVAEPRPRPEGQEP